MSRSDPKSLRPSHRADRVAEAIRHALADILARGEVADAVLERHVVTVPSVRMSPDLKLATIAVIALGDKDAAQTLKALATHKKELRARVAHRVNLRYAPDLRFVLDNSFDARDRIDALLRSPEVARALGREPEED
ncbi:MAG: 30S ribosome-binding factor RbfA [Roseiarcus sp.]